MKVYLNDIGIVKKSEIELNGVTIITGINNSGKSTVGKAVYSILSSIENLQIEALRDKSKFARKILIDSVQRIYWWINQKDSFQIEQEYLNVLNQKIDYIEDIKKNEDLERYVNECEANLYQFLENVQKKSRSADTKEEIDKIIVGIKSDCTMLRKSLEKDSKLKEYCAIRLGNTLNEEFNGQVTPVWDDSIMGQLRLKIEESEELAFSIYDKKVTSHSEVYTAALNNKKNVLFIDDVLVLDELKNERLNLLNLSKVKNGLSEFISGSNHTKCLSACLKEKTQNVYSRINNNEKIKVVFEKINAVFADEIEVVDGEYVCSQSKINIRNLAMGAKIFAIIKILLENGSIHENTILILDEPESHLHPEWQNILAELLVLLKKEMGVTILMTTHSTQFLLAMETYKEKYAIQSETVLYVTEKNEKVVQYKKIDKDWQEAYYRLGKSLFEIKQLKDTMRNENV